MENGKVPEQQGTAGQGRLFVGTSGWNFNSWRHGFYAGVRQRGWLRHCAERFTALEINGTHYRLATAKTQERWVAETPDGFPFVVKGHRYLTHYLRLGNARESLQRQKDNAAPLAPRIVAMLWQLPPRQDKNLPRLVEFGEALAEVWPGVPHVMEFRHVSWFDADVESALRDHGLTNCISDAASWPIWEAVTSDIVYIRLHGHEATYASNYDDQALEAWAGRVRRWREEGRDVHVYFDNDAHGWAPWNAISLLRILGESPAG